MEKIQKNKNDIEMRKIEDERNGKQAQFDKMVHEVEEIPDNEKKLVELDSTVDNKLISQSVKLNAEFKEQYNENSSLDNKLNTQSAKLEEEFKEQINENSSVNRLTTQANSINNYNINRLYNSSPARGPAST